jgi:hypothetical protein
VLGSTDGGLVNRLIIGFEADVEHHDSAVIATHSDQSGRVRMEVNAHHAGISSKAVLRPCWIFNCEAANQAGRLLQKIVATVSNGEEILVSGVPGHSSDVLAARLLCGEAPKRKHGAEGGAGGVVSVVDVVFVIFKLHFLRVLNDHSLHDFELALHACRVKGVFLVDLNNLLGFSVFCFGFHLLFKVCTGVILILLHVSIKNHPLGGLYRESARDWGVGLVAALTKRQIEGLRSALLVEELVAEGNSLGLGVALN